jgi:thiol-disulfide isomerase/thioredoxin
MRSIIDPTTGSFEFHIKVDHATLLGLANQFFIVLPGDTVKVNIIEIEGRLKLKFEGAKSLEHSFLLELKEKLGWVPVSKYLIDENSLRKYKEAATNHFDSCLVFLQNYFASGAESYKTIARNFLTVHYYNDLIYPLNTGNISKVKLPAGYFDDVDFSFLKKGELLGFREFILLIKSYNNYFYSLAPTHANAYDSATIEAKIQSANLNFIGEVKNNLLLFTFTGLVQNGSTQNQSQLDKLYEYLITAFVEEPSRIVQIHELKKEFDIIGKPLPFELLAERVKTKDGKQISLNEVLSTNEVVYIDFWASWCGPCLGEMPSEKQLISEFKGKAVKFILISLDDNEKKWQDAMVKISIEVDHYLISEGFKSELVKYISFNNIPRYLIFDKQGRVISRDAPRPGILLKDKSILLNLLN